MIDRARKPAKSAADFLPDSLDLDEMAAAVQRCRGCELYKNATQAVFGAGSPQARVVMIGEQPGDQEDQVGQPFVGPAGRLLDEVLEQVGIARNDVYITNAVKHFKWKPGGKRRLHAKPSAREMAACRPWLEAELESIHPDVIVCLGATAAQSLLGPAFRITRERGQFLRAGGASQVLATYHPSAILRAPDADARAQMRKDFVADLRKVARRLTR